MSPRGRASWAKVDVDARSSTRGNHTATHFLHKALREVVGDNVTQKGSYVGPDRLRFDFSNPKGVGKDELIQVERLVNEAIRRNDEVLTTEEAPEAAKARGVMALFGEKYGDVVRVVDVGGWSTELCGGTHVARAGDIGPFLIVSEQSISAGVRRIEALTGAAALEHIQEQRAPARRGGWVAQDQGERGARAHRRHAEAAQGRQEEAEGRGRRGPLGGAAGDQG